MIKIRKSEDRGHVSRNWLESRHTFSFGHYHDPEHMGFADLRVINDDIVAPGGGFPMHPHADMEIVTYVLEGALAHKDSMGNNSTIRPGEVQRMSAGTGITHSEFNPSNTDPVHLLQIWFLPRKKGIAPGYEQKSFTAEEKRGKFRLVAAHDGREGSVSLNQDVNMSVALLDGAANAAEYTVPEGRKAWVHLARGTTTLNGQKLTAGDGAAVEDETTLRFTDGQGAEVVVFEMGG